MTTIGGSNPFRRRAWNEHTRGDFPAALRKRLKKSLRIALQYVRDSQVPDFADEMCDDLKLIADFYFLRGANVEQGHKFVRINPQQFSHRRLRQSVASAHGHQLFVAA